MDVTHLRDSNNLKAINDSLGHREGDRALMEIAEVLRTLRESDVIARVGGDEFALLLVEKTENESEALIVRLQKGIDQRNALPGRTYRLSISVGTARSGAHGT